MVVLIDNGHGKSSGNSSPDKAVYEYAWSREMAQRLELALRERGINVSRIVIEEKDISISERCHRVNEVCRAYGVKNCLLVSIHNNASGSDGKWHEANGFSVFVSKNASTKSKKLASMITDAAIKRGLMGNRSIPKEKFWTWSWTKKDISLLKNTLCPAVLTENMFQDNHEDVRLLLSEEGKQKIVDLHVEGIINYINSL